MWVVGIAVLLQGSLSVKLCRNHVREMAVGSSACRHPLPMQIKTPYSTLNATKWLKFGGIGGRGLAEVRPC
jgi:hypothetical protein